MIDNAPGVVKHPRQKGTDDEIPEGMDELPRGHIRPR